jgi:nicotinamide-nucleotide amidase
MTPTATLITIGNELLNGRTTNTNATEIGRWLNELGITLAEVRTIPDTEGALRRALDDALATGPITIVSGGLGVTRDDLTKHILAAYFGDGTLVDHPPTLEKIKAFYAMRGRPLNDLTVLHAQIPACATPLDNQVGAAPGLHFTGPQGQQVFAIPGVPFEMRHVMETHIIPRLRETFCGGFIRHHTFCLAGIAESTLAKRVSDIENALPPGLSLAYNPAISHIRLRITAQGAAAEANRLVTDMLRAQESLQERLVPYCFGTDEATLPQALGALLRQQGLSIATAESCTGGAVAAALVTVPGASEYVKGGVVAYANAAKLALLDVPADILEAHGAVSESVAIAMALGARKKLGADVALSTTGVAGPTGDSADKPVGTVWIGYADAAGAFAIRSQFDTDRQRNIDRSVAGALWLAYRTLAELPEA